MALKSHVHGCYCCSALALTLCDAGTDTHVFMWDPALMNTNPGALPEAPQEATTKHIVYIFRQGRFLIKLTGSGFVGSPAMELTPHFISEVAAIVADRIVQHDITAVGRVYRELRAPFAAYLRELALVFTSQWSNVTASSLSAWNQTQTWAADHLALTNSSTSPFGSVMGGNLPLDSQPTSPVDAYTPLNDDINYSVDMDLDDDFLDSSDVEGDVDQERVTWMQAMQASSSMARSWLTVHPNELDEGEASDVCISP
eukprot:m.111165 g.111165  ORF g.111165 m.111165 type:complete len:256 (+) comp15377_c0_seq2:737-1504(+)